MVAETPMTVASVVRMAMPTLMRNCKSFLLSIVVDDFSVDNRVVKQRGDQASHRVKSVIQVSHLLPTPLGVKE